MKKLQFIIVAFLIFYTLHSNAQISVNINIGSHPTWCNYEEEEYDYYYLPEIEAYYDVRSSAYVYLGPRGWVRSVYLPEYCQDYDVNHCYRVAIDYRGNCPYTYFNNDRERYFRNNHKNYRNEYYRPNYEHRREYAIVENHPRGRDNDNYYREKNRPSLHLNASDHYNRRHN